MKFLILPCWLCLVSLTAGGQRSIRFIPTVYYPEYSAKADPALRIQEGDTVYTQSADALGLDYSGNRVAPRGNPLTGPFFIENADAGDVIAVTLHHVRLNRNFATTLNSLIPKMLPRSIAMKNWRAAKLVRWHLDIENNTGTPADTAIHLNELKVPLHPFLGCVGVAPAGSKPANSGASGPYGGNMDFRFTTAGATIYLPVNYKGALLYLGDGHAAQGDGELNGDALETSMDFSFSVRVLKKNIFPLETPMVENEKYLMFFGIENTLDKALQSATAHLQNWLQSRYGLSVKQVSQVIGPAVEYRIPKVASSKVEIFAMIPKALLTSLIPVPN